MLLGSLNEDRNMYLTPTGRFVVSVIVASRWVSITLHFTLITIRSRGILIASYQKLNKRANEKVRDRLPLILAELRERAKRAQYLRKFGNLSIREMLIITCLPVRPHHRETNEKCQIF